MLNFPFSKFEILQTYNMGECAYQWTLDPLFEDITPFNFVVEVAEAPDFSELLYSIDAGNSFFTIDDHNMLQTGVLVFYIRVKLTTGSGKVYYSRSLNSGATASNAHLLNTAREIIRKEFVRFRYTGQAGWILKRKNFKELAINDIDPITGAALNDRSADYGTTYLEGYYAPLKVTYSREGMSQAVKLSEQGFGTAHDAKIKARFVGFPEINPQDILVTDGNTRYRITATDETYMPGTDIILSRACDGSLLPFNDPIYKLQV